MDTDNTDNTEDNEGMYKNKNSVSLNSLRVVRVFRVPILFQKFQPWHLRCLGVQHAVDFPRSNLLRAEWYLTNVAFESSIPRSTRPVAYGPYGRVHEASGRAQGQ